MARFVARRLLQAVPALFGISLLGFFLVHMVPGGPADAMLGPRAAPDRVVEIDRQFGLNRPLWIQYGLWLWQLLHGHLGTSYFYNETVGHLLAVNLPRTLSIVGLGILFAHIGAILIGSLQAYYLGTRWEKMLTVITYFFYSMPIFWLGIILLMIFSFQLNWLPSGGAASVASRHAGPGSWAAHIALPVMTITLATIAGWGRYIRASMIEALVQDYVRTARAKGLSEFAVVVKHALRNSLLPLVTLLGLSLPNLFAGSLLVESVFNYPGMGFLFWTAAMQRDYPVILGVIMWTGVLTVLGNLLADLLYAVIDPRIPYR